MGVAIIDRVIEKIISLLKAETNVTKYTGSGSGARIYGAHLSTIQDFVLPAVSIFILPGARRGLSGGFLDQFEIQVEPWILGVGSGAGTWDDVMEMSGTIVAALHRSGGWDSTIGVKITEITCVSKGPQMQDPDGIMHFPSRWKVRATV